MFTGIIEEVGRVADVTPMDDAVEIAVGAAAVLEGLRLGDSIAVDGVCQTVVAVDPASFTVQAVGTTLARTTLGDLVAGRAVNLERALAVGDRLGGHMVQGHVDATGEVLAIVPSADHTLIDVRVPSEIDDVTILHGSITIDGVSLTVNALPEPGIVQVSIIPFTMGRTTIGDYTPGRQVNLEGDLIGKYVRRLIGPAGADPRAVRGYQ